MATAYQNITTRGALHAAADIEKYYAAEIDATGKVVKATGAGQFLGMIEYGGKLGEMVTYVRGTFPGIAAEAIATGDKLTVGTGENAGKLVKAVVGPPASVVYGIAQNDAAIGGLVSILMADIISPVVTA